LFAPPTEAPRSAHEAGTASRAPVGRVSHEVFCSGKKLTVSEVAPLPSRAARKLGYVSSMKVFDRQKRLIGAVMAPRSKPVNLYFGTSRCVSSLRTTQTAFYPWDQCQNPKMTAFISGLRPPSWVLLRLSRSKNPQLQVIPRQNRSISRQLQSDSRLGRDNPRQNRCNGQPLRDGWHPPQSNRRQPRDKSWQLRDNSHPLQDGRHPSQDKSRQKPAFSRPKRPNSGPSCCKAPAVPSSARLPVPIPDAAPR